jgi:hypothetical protein
LSLDHAYVKNRHVQTILFRGLVKRIDQQFIYLSGQVAFWKETHLKGKNETQKLQKLFKIPILFFLKQVFLSPIE